MHRHVTFLESFDLYDVLCPGLKISFMLYSELPCGIRLKSTAFLATRKISPMCQHKPKLHLGLWYPATCECDRDQ